MYCFNCGFFGPAIRKAREQSKQRRGCWHLSRSEQERFIPYGVEVAENTPVRNVGHLTWLRVGYD
jgi:hypothetical protein